MFIKHKAYLCISNVPTSSPEHSPGKEGNVLLCTRAGQRPELTDGKMMVSAKAEQLAPFFKEAPLRSLPSDLQGVTSTAAPSFRKGDIARVTVPLEIEGSEPIPTGTLMKCQRGGKSPSFMLPDEANPYQGSIIQTSPESFEKVGEIITPMLEDVKIKINTFEEMSEETLAKRGTISIGTTEIGVQNSGHGEADILWGEGLEVLESHLKSALDHDPVMGKKKPAEITAITKKGGALSLSSLYVTFAVSFHYRLKTFGEYLSIVDQQEAKPGSLIDLMTG